MLFLNFILYKYLLGVFNFRVRTFPNQPAELQKEIILMTDALRVPEEETTPAHQFYLKMFQHISYTVQQNILLITADYLKNNLDHCRLLILLMKRFPNTVVTHVVSANIEHKYVFMVFKFFFSL